MPHEKSVHRLEFSVDSLEGREMLSGVVNVIVQDNDVRVLGDGQDNRLTIRTENNRLVVLGNDSEVVIGGDTGLLASQVENLRIMLRGGNDAVTLNAPVGGDLRIVMGGGNDLISLGSQLDVMGRTTLMTREWRRSDPGCRAAVCERRTDQHGRGQRFGALLQLRVLRPADSDDGWR